MGRIKRKKLKSILEIIGRYKRFKLWDKDGRRFLKYMGKNIRAAGSFRWRPLAHPLRDKGRFKTGLSALENKAIGLP